MSHYLEEFERLGRKLYVRHPFFVQEPRTPYKAIPAQNEAEVEKLLTDGRSGWRVWQAGARGEWTRRTDLERGKYGEPGG